MKKHVCAVLICALIFGIAGCGGTGGEASPTSAAETPRPTEAAPAEAAGNEPIVFADAAFEDKVREVLGKAEGDITAAEAAAVTELDLQMPGNDWSIPRIADLSDLQYFPNLISLNLSWALAGDGGVDLSPLAGLTKLEGLAIACTNVQGIEPLAALTNLKDLQCWGLWSITDVSPLAGLTELESLRINDNLIADVSPLAGLINLQMLCIENNMVSDVSPLSGLSNLKILTINGNPIKDYTPLSDIFPGLETCDFELLDHSVPIIITDSVLESKIRASMDVPEGDITPEMAEEVTELNLANPYSENIPDEDMIHDISSLRYFPNLFKLELQFNRASDGPCGLKVLWAMTGLGILDLNGNNLFDLDALSPCKSLVWLNLSGNFEEDLGPIAGLTGLKSLYLSYSPQIHDASALAGLTSLQALYMEGLAIEDYTPISNLTKLTTLYINPPGEFDVDISPLAGIYGNLTDKNFEMD